MKEVINKEIEIGFNVKLIKKLYKVKKSYEYPTGLKFCFQYLYLRNEK